MGNGIDVAVDADDDPRCRTAPVRLNADPRFAGQEPLLIDGRTWDVEVVWGRRLCPARIQLLNVPTPESGHRCGDIVLIDGDPVGSRMLGDHSVDVFNQIALWERSPVPTLTSTVRALTPHQAAAEWSTERSLASPANRRSLRACWTAGQLGRRRPQPVAQGAEIALR